MRTFTEIAPYFHPTTVVAVDDNRRFMHSIALGLPDDLRYFSYLSPEEALEQINKPHPRYSLADRCFTRNGNVINLDLNVIEQEVKHIDRFERVSVLLVDYAMPTMNGLEFCAEVHDRDIKRILLTGVADEKTAVRAFNQGLIDHYLPKINLRSPRGVIPYIHHLQESYFQQYLPRLTRALDLEPPAFMSDPLFRSWFLRLAARLDAVEYYFVPNPMGFLLLQADGTPRQLIVSEDQTDTINLMRRHGASQTLIDAVERNEIGVMLLEHPDDYGNETFPWEEFVYPCEVVSCRETWLCGVVENPPMDIDYDPPASSFARFLATAQMRN